MAHFAKLSAFIAALLLAQPAAAQPARVLDSVRSEYNSIIVRQLGSQVMLDFQVGRCEFVESVRDLSDPAALPVEYTRSVTAALAYPARLDSILEIGVGGASTLTYLHRHLPQTRLTGVEIDAAVIRMAQKHFGLKPDARLNIVIADGRAHLAASPARHDLIIVDAYRGTWVPETLTSVEFFQLVKSRLAPGGAVAQNVEPTTLFYDGLAATLAQVFDHVDAYGTEAGGGPSNVVLVAYDGPKRAKAALEARAQALQRAHAFHHPLPELVAQGAPAVFAASAQPFRDDRSAANAALMIDRANAADTPRTRKERCG
jgi:spermidine synthase